MTRPETPDQPAAVTAEAAPAPLAQRFEAPWQAQAFAMTVLLHEKGLFDWSDWADALSARLAESPPEAPIHDARHTEYYYRCWMRALEDLIARSGGPDADAVDRAAQIWQRAAEATPHGQPILFETGLVDH
ncbi:nitrile hydratase accessory protein [Pseudooceanicola sp. C21-150M6]|uniref:nitrile hydratase accessory protein n=1 Tax=Pseudooceanicola sp. C21-150M6 TaxID=3434355 RepID=UPI003D7F60D1